MLVNLDENTSERIRQAIRDCLPDPHCASCDGHACWYEDDAKDAAEWADLLHKAVLGALGGSVPPGSAYERAQEDV